MNSTSLRIAWRYLFAKKSHNAINIVSGISAAGVAVVSAAMVVVLSVMNGFGALVERMFSAFDPDLKITATTGKHFYTDTEQIEQLRTLPYVAVYSETVEETGLCEFAGKQVPVLLKGVDYNFAELTHIDSIMTDGEFLVVNKYDDAAGESVLRLERCVLGLGLANQLGIGAHFVGGLRLYAPKREGRVNMLRPDKSFNQSSAFISGIFAVNQTKYDDKYMLISLPLARHLFDYTANQATAIELKLSAGVSQKKAKREISALLGSDFSVKDRYEQQEDFFKIMQIEKALTVILLIFILLLASFNIIGSLSMLMIDKREDTQILGSLGADRRMLSRIFLYEGWMISLLGAAAGLILGLAVSLGQQYFGWIKLGTGTEYIVSSYPVEVQALDILLVAATVCLLGWLAAWIPSRKLKTEDNR